MTSRRSFSVRRQADVIGDDPPRCPRVIGRLHLSMCRMLQNPHRPRPFTGGTRLDRRTNNHIIYRLLFEFKEIEWFPSSRRPGTCSLPRRTPAVSRLLTCQRRVEAGSRAAADAADRGEILDLR
jgi:hypothetical protein